MTQRDGTVRRLRPAAAATSVARESDLKRKPRDCRDFYSTPVKTSTTLLQLSCQETIAKMIEYLSFILQCTTVMTLGATAYYIYSLIKMTESTINELLLEVLHNPPESDVKRQKLIECVLTENSKQYLGKAYTEEQAKKLSAEEMDKLFSNYEAKLSGQLIKSLGNQLLGCIRWGLVQFQE